MLDYLLRDGPEVVARGALHSARMFDTMVQYLRAKGASYKHKIVGLLTQLLKTPLLFPPGDRPNVAGLRGIETCVFAYCRVNVRGVGGGAFHYQLSSCPHDGVCPVLDCEWLPLGRFVYAAV